MRDEIVWRPLLDELARWQKAGKSAHLWLRDDDAVQPTEPLDRLLALSDRFSVPMTLAVIPASTDEALAVRLADQRGISVAVHGWTHENHASASEKKQELGSHRSPSQVLAELRDGFAKLRSLYARRFVPVLVPPWNRIASNLLPELPSLGYGALSVFGIAKPGLIAQVNTHVDIMDWHGTGGCRPHTDIVEDIVRQLTHRFEDDSEPIGILTHHLVHDAAAWDFIATLFEVMSGSGAARWHSLEDFLD
jgi:peptidoglycan/xylan/chitin deacetylase (PgdA/CDA1 family)